MNVKHILLVEDEQPIREMVVFALTNASYEVHEAADARQAQVCIAERLPDLILLDWMLPGISGIDYARRLKKDDLTRELPIIMLTARAEEEDKVQGLESGADDLRDQAIFTARISGAHPGGFTPGRTSRGR
jgi:two-component system phosphate regulon response regulator PhoB